MGDDEILDRYRLHPCGQQLDEVRNLLIGLAQSGADADTEAMKLCCVLLFHHGSLADVPLIWQAKESSWDAHCSIDVQLLSGAGVAATKAFPAHHPESEARQALDYLIRCEAAGDFDGFSVSEQSASYRTYYRTETGSVSG